jgi:PAS domain S-box-containing protein
VLVEAECIQPLLEDFYRLTRIPMAVIDVAGRVVAGAGWQDVCLDFHRAHPETCANCIASDVELTRGVPPGEFRMYKCKNGMWDVATPLIVGGEHVANVFSGQFFFDDEPLDAEGFRAQARQYGFDEEQYMAALEQAPRLSREAVKTGMAYLTKLAGLICSVGYKNLELGRALDDREQLMKSLRESEEMLKRAQAIAHLGSWELDLIGGRLHWSDESYRIFGLEPQEFGATYETFLSFVHPDDRRAVDEAYSGSVRDGKASYEITHRIVRRGTEEVRWVHEKCEHVRDADGRIIRSMGMVHDITEQRQAEEEIRHKQKLESVGLLAAGVAHDFNNLLVGMLGNASLAQQQLDPAHPIGDLLEEVVRSAQRAADLTRQLLAYAGKGKFVIERIDLSSFAEEMVGLLGRTISKKIAVRLDLSRDLPPVEADRGQIQQVFMNLLINAAEAIGTNAGAIEVRTRALHASAEQLRGGLGGAEAPAGDYVRLDVSDDGPGMTEDVRRRIFDPFFTTKFHGRGLGLAAVGGVVRSHRGVIQVTSQPGHGTRFTIFFPAGRRKPLHSRAERAVGSIRGTESILVVDDEDRVRALACKALEHYGYSAIGVSGGAEALEILQGDCRVDAVLLDANMPVLSGAELTPLLHQVRPEVRIVLSSGFGES